MNLETDKLEAMYHAALILSKRVRIASSKADREVEKLLLEHGSFQNIFEKKDSLFPKYDLEEVKGLDKVVKVLEKVPDFRTLTVADSEFPKSLRGITPVIYCQGDVSLLNEKSIAVVGTREPEINDELAGTKYTMNLVEEGYTIVSGLARGCDTLAHEIAINYKGRTIAVLGEPLYRLDGREPSELQQRIAEEHLLVSQFPVGLTTFPSHFAYRNATTVGLASDGIVVIKAGDAGKGKTSGTLHAVRAASEQGKKIIVLPANKQFEWTKQYEITYATIT